MNNIEKAIADLSDIRSQLAASTRFRGYAPEAVAVVGLVSLLILAAQLAWPERLAASDRQQALIWGAVLLAGCAAVLVEALTRARRQHHSMAAAMLQGAMRVVAPIVLVDVATGYAVLAYAPQAAWMLPGLWQMLIGVAAFASYPTMPPGIAWPAACYLLCGALVMLAAGVNGGLTPWMCGGPLVAGHLAIAWLLWKRERQA